MKRFADNPDWVYFVRDVVIDELPPTSVVEYAVAHHNFSLVNVPTIREEQITTKRATVMEFHAEMLHGRETFYLAVSEDVQELLGKPFDMIMERLQRADRSVHTCRQEKEEYKRKVTTAPLMKRLKYLFTRTIN